MNGMSRAENTAIELQNAAKSLQDAASLIQSIAHSLEVFTSAIPNHGSTDPAASLGDSTPAAEAVFEMDMAQLLTMEDIQAALTLAKWRRNIINSNESIPPQSADSRLPAWSEIRLPSNLTTKESEAVLALIGMWSEIRFPKHLTDQEIEATLALTALKTGTSANKGRSRSTGLALTIEDIQAAVTLTRMPADTSADEKSSTDNDHEDDSEVEQDQEDAILEFVQGVKSQKPRCNSQSPGDDANLSRAFP